MMYLSLNEIDCIQFEHTTRCNLECPQCSRTVNDFVNKKTFTDLELEDYKSIFEPIKERAIKVFFCGNFGDALAAPNFDEIFDYLIKETNVKIVVTTNGSLRDADWWESFAKRGSNRLKVTFSIDGLSSTNHIYRKGSSWTTIIENVKAYTKHGGWARWDFIEFKHNYHQRDQAKDLAHKLGFKEFNFKYTARFAEATAIEAELGLKKSTPTTVIKENKNNEDFTKLSKKYGSFEEYVNKTEITCKTKLDKTIFIDMNMRVWPCCWFGDPLYSKVNPSERKDFLYLEEKYGKAFNSFRTHGWNILNHDFFACYLSNSWSNPDDNFKRVYVCGRTCGAGYESSSGYGKNSNKEVLVN